MNDGVNSCTSAIGNEAFEFVGGVVIEGGRKVGNEKVTIGFGDRLAIGIVIF